MSEESDELRAFWDQIGRRAAEAGMEEVEHLHFLTVYPELEDIFSVPIVNKEGQIAVDGLGKVMRFVPPENLDYYNVGRLVTNQLSRTGNITKKEAELMWIDIKLQLLELEMMTGKVPRTEKAYEVFLYSALLDAIEAHRMKAVTIRTLEASLQGAKKKRGKILGIF